ncbi:MAG: trypsin-like serine protease, partial [Proteobacteria bacterium]|nr:trypsin-like serine protease [Pseudomonadota bacterium]
MHNFLHRLLLSCLPSLSLSMLIACGPPSSQDSLPQVIGGNNAAAPSYFVAIHLDGDKTPFCGGSLIAKNIVLTAAHCVNQNRGPISVWIGIETLNNLPQARPVQA